MNGVEFLKILGEREQSPMPPVMLLTGGDSTAVAVEAMKQGAWDYLGKDVDLQYLDRLPNAIRRMLREQHLAEGKRQAEANFRTLVEQIQAITYIAAVGEANTLLYISPQIKALGYSSEEWKDDPELHLRMMHPDDRAAATAAIAHSRIQARPLRQEYRLIARDGRVLWFREEAKPVADGSGEVLFIQGILVDVTQSKHAEEALRQSQEELRRLAAHQERLKEEERKRIAQEIHDELGGLLTSIKAFVLVANDRAVRAGAQPDPLLLDAASLAETGLKAVRKVITDLRPSVLDQLGIWAALEWYAGQIEERSGILCDCTIAESALCIELDPERSTMLFRVVQEALTNVVRHARASSVSIDVAASDVAITVAVKDDGMGIDTERLLNRESWGILGMYERTRHFGGELRITGKPGQGTSVVLQLPLEQIHA
jgi:two-component system sensor histidine kinase UhpB